MSIICVREVTKGYEPRRGAARATKRRRVHLQDVLATSGGRARAIHALAAEPPVHVVGWSIPGVLIGSTIGSGVSRYLLGAPWKKDSASSSASWED